MAALLAVSVTTKSKGKSQKAKVKSARGAAAPHFSWRRASRVCRRARVALGRLLTFAFCLLPFAFLLTALLAVSLISTAAAAQTLNGTKPLTLDGDPAARMLEGIDRYLTGELAASPGRRATRTPDREGLRRIIGVVDTRRPFEAPSLMLTNQQEALVAEGAGYRVLAVRWPALEGVDAEGLLFEPSRPPLARIVALGDAAWTPEMMAGLAPGVAAAAQFARRLAENGCQVLAPVLLSRRPTGLFNPLIRRPTNQTHREFVYRMAFEVGRHVIGYEAQKTLAAVDWFARAQPAAPIGVMGYGEGGLIALHSAAVDTRIDAALVSGHFRPRENVWREPIYRNVWGLLTEFGDAELAGLVAPRALIIEAARGPEVGPPPAGGESGTGAAPGVLETATLAEVRAEVDRARPAFAKLGAAGKLVLAENREGRDDPGSEAALAAFLRALGSSAPLRPLGDSLKDRRQGFEPAERELRQFHQLVEAVQVLVRSSESARREFWSKADASSVESWNRTKQPYRQHLWEEVLGKLPAASEPLAARSRLEYDRPGWTGHEVLLPLYPEVFAYGILLVPKDLRPGEKRPAVVAQHGRAGRPRHLIEPDSPRADQVYKRFAAQLADRGFVVYVPQNPYIFEEQYRMLQRKANPLKLSLFSFIAAQHQRTLDWLGGLPFVDGQRIGYYGLSYGGKTAVRVPPLDDRYALSICSGDFNEYAGKMASTERPDSFLFTNEHEMYEFNLANTFNYSDMANLMAPRPFMVERGHDDGVGLDEWVAYEYAKVRRFYTRLGIGDRTEIEFFHGGHEIRAEGSFRFLERHLGR